MSFKTKRLRLLLLAGLSAPLILATLAFGVAAEERSPVTFLTDPARLEAVRLPQELRWASDVRWHKGSVVLVSGGRAGTRALDLADPEFRITEIYRPSTFFGVAGFHYTLARTRDWIFFGGAVRAVMWREVDRGPQDEYR